MRKDCAAVDVPRLVVIEYGIFDRRARIIEYDRAADASERDVVAKDASFDRRIRRVFNVNRAPAVLVGVVVRIRRRRRITRIIEELRIGNRNRAGRVRALNYDRAAGMKRLIIRKDALLNRNVQFLSRGVIDGSTA